MTNFFGICYNFCVLLCFKLSSGYADGGIRTAKELCNEREMIMKHNKKGFTLVELVVVIAIIGVIAAILVPSLMGYVKKSRLQAANANAKLAYNAVSAYVTESQGKGIDLTTALNDFSQAATNTGLDCTSAPSSDADQKIYNMLSQNGIESGFVWVLRDITVNGKNSYVVQWAKGGASDTVWGQYPDPIEWEDYSNYIQNSSFHPGQYVEDWSSAPTS